MKKLVTLGLSLLTFGLLGLTTHQENVVHAAEINEPFTLHSINPTTRTYYISNAKMFKILEENGVDVKSILGEEEYQQALRDDLFRAGSSWITTYKVGKETRISMGVNSAIVKTWKYGQHGVVLAIQAYGVAVGMPLDAMVSNGIHNTIKTIDASRGYKWNIGTKPWRIISHGYQ